MAQSISIDSAVEKDNLFIPLIDFSLFLDGTPDQKAQTSTAILEGFQKAGFIYIKNHGLSPFTVRHVFSQSASFFAQPQPQKDALAWYSARANRGYTAHGREKVTQLEDKDEVEKLREAAPDLKESMEIGREGEPDCPNLWPASSSWPSGAEEFRTTMQSFHAQCAALHTQIMRAIAAGLGIQETWFDEYTSQADNTLRLLHYPAVSREVFKKNKMQVRAGEHSDYGSITLLFQDDRGGLQVQSPQGTFVDATPIPDTIVINAGDLLARWSNDSIKSTKHRVVEPPLKTDEVMGTEEHPARYSIAYFCNPNFDKFIDVIPSTVKDGETKKYEGVNSGDYLARRLGATYVS